MTKKIYFLKKICFLIILSLSLNTTITCFSVFAYDTPKNPTLPHKVDFDFESLISELYTNRNKLFLDGDMSKLVSYYDTSNCTGKYSITHELQRISYLRDWANERGIKFTNITSSNKFRKLSATPKFAKFRVDEEYKFDYVYTGDPVPVTNSFGVTLFHVMNFTNKNDKWLISQDWYLDCFEDGLKKYNIDFNNIKNYSPKEKIYDFLNFKPLPTQVECNLSFKKGGYDRLKAVEYADKYCGVTWASKNATKYNKRYKNFTGSGGNCTNYVSQCLGDKEGGALRQGGGWNCVYGYFNGAESSAAWVNADSFKHSMLYTGRGSLIKCSDFKSLLKPLDSSPQGALGILMPGDVISYSKGSDVDHTAIVTSFDSHGYPLINSHTVDRYHVPFDLGWGDKNIYFNLIHIN